MVIDKPITKKGIEEDRSSLIPVVIIAIALTVVLASCSFSSSSSTNNGQVQTGSQVDDGSSMQSGSKSSGVSMDSSNKSEKQKINDTMQAILADGTYQTDVAYRYHAGIEHVHISITVENDIVTDASVTGINSNHMSLFYINSFNNALPTMVVGKRIDELNLPHNVAGSSLTNGAFQYYVASLLQA